MSFISVKITTMLVSLLVIAVITVIVLSVGLYEKSTNAVCLSRRRLEGKTVIVTGGTLGMGLVIATDLAHRGARVIIASPFEHEGIKARDQIIEETKNKNVIFKLLDLASLESTRKFAADILKSEDRLDILINNAGVGLLKDCLTKDGLNFIMQVNYYGAFLLTLLLLPLLKKTGRTGEPSRIITTTSVTHRIGQVDLENVNKENYWCKMKIYSNSKIFLLYFAHELTKRLKGSSVVINNVDPGAVGTRIFDQMGISIGTFMTLICLFLFKNPWYGAQTALHVALDESAGKVSGEYFRNCKINRAVKRAYDDEIARVIWKDSVRLVKLTDYELEQCFQSG